MPQISKYMENTITIQICCLERQKRLLMERWQTLDNQYSIPHFQLKEIDDKINKLKWLDTSK